MKTGQIIRRKISDGTPVGPYLRIEEFKCNSKVVVAHMINGKSTSVLARANVYEPKVLNFVLSDDIVTRIKEKIQKAIIHDISQKWNMLKMHSAEIVQIRSVKYGTRTVVVRIDKITNPISVTESQSKSTTYSTSNKDIGFTAYITESPTCYATLRVTLLQVCYHMIGNFAQASTQQRFHNNGGNS